MLSQIPAAMEGIKVLDLSRILAGPWCTQILGDLGADVIKVERPGSGDDTRGWAPPFFSDSQGQQTDQSTYFAACNRNKRSITVDMTVPEGQLLLRRMAAQSDVVVENFKVGGLKQYGLDYESLRAINPRLVYCSISGFGQDGPYAARAGYDLMIQAMCGMMSITGRPDGEPGGGPLRVGVAIIDIVTGVYASVAILAALRVRDQAGEGQHIDMALLDVGMAMLANQASAFLNDGGVPARTGNTHPSLAPYQEFMTSDGAMLLAIGNNGQFVRFCQAAGHPEIADDQRFGSNSLRVQNRDTLIPLLDTITRKRSTTDWTTLLEDKVVPCSPINDLASAFADPQVRARKLSISLECQRSASAPDIDSIRMVSSPLRLKTTPPVLRNAPPWLGQHTSAILEDLGLTATDVSRLQDAGAI